MAIPARRFEILTGETNVGINDFLEKKDSTILNLDSSQIIEITEDIQGFADISIEDPLYIDNLLAEANAFARTLDAEPATPTRSTLDLLGTIKDLSKLSSKSLDKMLSNVLPGNSALSSTLFGSMSLSCKQNNFGLGGLGKPFNLTVDCGNGIRNSKSSCNNGQFSNVLNKLTGGNSSPAFKDRNAELKNLMSLSMHGYGLNLCGVFGSLGSLVPDLSVLNRAAAGIASNLSQVGNALGMFDLASAVSSFNLSPILEVPNIVNNFLTNFSIPSGITDNLKNTVTDRVLATAEIFDNDWNFEDEFDMLSMEEISMGFNDELDDIMQCSMLGNNEFNEDDLDYIPNDDFTFSTVAYSTSQDIDDDYYADMEFM
jgi:hypothetical protein